LSTTKDIADRYQLNSDKVKEVSGMAKDVAQSTISTVQEGVQSGLEKAQDMLSTLLVGLEVAQKLLTFNKRRARLKKAQKSMRRVQGAVQERVQAGLTQTQEALQTGLSAAQDTWEQGSKRTRKNLKKAQKNLKRIQGTVQENLQAGLGVVQDTWEQSAKGARKSLKKAGKNVKDVQNSLQSQLEKRARKRQRRKAMFRVGLLTGLVLVLLYTPWPGSETRRRIAALGQKMWQGWQNR